MAVACRPSGPRVAEMPDMEEMPPFDPATQQTITYLEIAHIQHFLDSNPDVIVLDVRGRDEFDKVHLPKAISFPYDPKEKKKMVDKSLAALSNYDTKKIHFVYGSKENYYALDVCNRLRIAGYQYLFCIRQDSGIEDWVKAGLPVVSTPAAE